MAEPGLNVDFTKTCFFNKAACACITIRKYCTFYCMIQHIYIVRQSDRHTFQPPSSWKRKVLYKALDHVGGTMAAKILDFTFSKIFKNLFPGHFALSNSP